MLILGIETSCDDTSVAVLRVENGKPEVLANVVSSQINTHSPYGGVVPLLAAREHERNLPLVLQEAFKVSGLKFNDIDLIAVTSGPGLIMSLVRGVNFAKELAAKTNKPLIGVNHMSGHIYSNWLPPIENSKFEIRNPKFPALCLIVSGGHTELVLMRDHGVYELVGRTVDDATGEAFDKIARLIGLPYPGGPAISALAEKFEARNSKSEIKLPRPMLHSKDLNFSFSGLKTAVLYLVRDLTVPLDTVCAEIAHEAQEAIVDVLISKTKKAIELHHPASLLLAGGVSANKLLRKRFGDLASLFTIHYSLPPLEYTTDNAAMIAMAAYQEFKGLKLKVESLKPVEANANWEIA